MNENWLSSFANQPLSNFADTSSQENLQSFKPDYFNSNVGLKFDNISSPAIRKIHLTLKEFLAGI